MKNKKNISDYDPKIVMHLRKHTDKSLGELSAGALGDKDIIALSTLMLKKRIKDQQGE